MLLGQSATARSQRRASQTSSQSTLYLTWSRPVVLLLLLLAAQSSAAPFRNAQQALDALGASKFSDAANKAGFGASLLDPRWSATLLVPTDMAFRGLGDDHEVEYSNLNGMLLSRIISYHMVPGPALSTRQLTHGRLLVTAQGQSLTVDTKSKVVIRGFGGAGVIVKPNIAAGRVTIHLIDGVLYPNLNPVPGCLSVMGIAQQEGLVDFWNLANFCPPGGGQPCWGTQLNDPTFTGTVFIPTNAGIKLNARIKPAGAQQMVSAHIAGGAPLTESNMLQGQGIRFLGGGSYTVDRSGRPRGFISLKKGRSTAKVIKSFTACQASVHMVNAALS